MTTDEFRALLGRFGSARASNDTQAAAALFAEDVHFVDPLRYSLDGRDAVKAFFDESFGVEQRVVWYNVLFDEARQIGTAEYSRSELSHNYHGVVLVRVSEHGLITHWREFQHVSDFSWQEFWGDAAFRD